MNYLTKTCPRCQSQLQPGDGAFELVTFELVRRGMGSSEPSPGLPVSQYSCPKCGYIELYDLKVVGRI